MKDFPFTKFAVFFILGILFERVFHFSPFTYLLITIGLLILIFTLLMLLDNIESDLIITLLTFLTVFVTGSFLASTSENKYDSLLVTYQKEKNASLFGEVTNIELKKDFEIVFTVITDSIFLDSKKIITNDKLICKFRGDSLQRSSLYDRLYPGNKIFITGTYQKGREKRNPGEFDYDAYLKSKGITGLFISYNTDSVKIENSSKNLFKSKLYTLRKIIDNRIHDLHQPETAGLLRGLLLADRSEISYETKNEFINSGVIHILAVSGLHVGYILLIFVFILGRFGIISRSDITIIGLITFMFITGVPPSVFRATIMAIILIIAFLSGRSTNIINSIAIAAVVILLFNPDEIYNPGFQLSFSAVTAIGLIYPYFKKLIHALKIKYKWVQNVLLFMAVSLSAQIGTLPFTLAYFSKLSLISLFANLLIIPLVGVIIADAFLTLFISVISFQLGSYFASANDLFSWIIFSLIRFAGSLSYSFVWVRDYSLYDSIIFYSSIILIILIIKKIKNLILKFALVVIAIFSIIFFSRFDDKDLLPNDKLSVMMIDVGQGDSFLIKFPDGKTAMIDAGEANPYFDNGERIISPLLDYLGIKQIDYGFISHLDLDHYGGFVYLIANDKIREIYRPKPDSSEKSLRLEKFLKKKNIKAHIYSKTHLDIDNTRIYILNDTLDYVYNSFSGNDKSGVLKIVYGSNSFLFIGDCEFPAESYLLSKYDNYLKSDVLKVGHHGSKTGSSKSFLNLVHPKYSLISTGIKNKFNHPASEVLDNLHQINSEILRTDLSGAALLISDGKNIEIINWRE